MAQDAQAPGLTTAALRAIQGSGSSASGRAEQVADRLAGAIRSGLLPPGQRLPAEVELADQFGVATLTLRQALAILRDWNLVTTRRGRNGGSFVAAARWVALETGGLGRLSVQALRELGDLRQAVSGTAALLAAARAMPSEIEALQRRLDRLRRAETPNERRRADTELAIELAAAAQSHRLTGEEARLRAELGDLAWLGRTDDQHLAAVRARATLIVAVRRGNGVRARRIVERQVEEETTYVVQRRIDLYAALQ
jgi:GntR family transcriptional repressor for pyruvate dehydrogenase complex